MKINTKYLGKVEIDKKQIIYFKKGLPGFEGNKRFVLLEVEELIGFKFLQDIKKSDLCFVVVNPYYFFPNYEFKILDENLENLGINDIKNIAIYNIITLANKLEESTVNLLAPIIINTKNMYGEQFILNDGKYSTRHKLFPKGDNNASTK